MKCDKCGSTIKFGECETCLDIERKMKLEELNALLGKKEVVRISSSSLVVALQEVQFMGNAPTTEVLQ